MHAQCAIVTKDQVHKVPSQRSTVSDVDEYNGSPRSYDAPELSVMNKGENMRLKSPPTSVKIEPPPACDPHIFFTITSIEKVEVSPYSVRHVMLVAMRA